MSIIKSLREYFSECPVMDGFTDGHVDWTDEKSDNYGISPAGDTRIKRYVDGTELRKYDFVIYARFSTAEDAQKMQNSEWVEEFQEYIRKQNLGRNLPEGDEKTIPEKLTANNGLLFSYDENGLSGVYQVQLELIYRRL